MSLNEPIVVCGGGGFIGGHLVGDLLRRGCTHVRSVDIKPISNWLQVFGGAENVCLDLREKDACRRAVAGAAVVYNLAADMGGMGFIEHFRIECLRNILINTHLIEAAQKAGIRRYFFASSACVYNTRLQENPNCRALKEEDAYPAYAERGYGWEKLFSEMVCQEYWAERKMKTFIARFHNVYGPCGTWDGGREKAPAAICRKVIEAKNTGKKEIVIWGDGCQMRSFTYIEDCLQGIDKVIHCDNLIATPINLGSSEMISINDLVTFAEEIGGIKVTRKYDLNSPKGVAGRNSDNTFIRKMLGWEPSTRIKEGLKSTYRWIELQYHDRLAGKETVRDVLP